MTTKDFYLKKKCCCRPPLLLCVSVGKKLQDGSWH
jgi:hypothetical protein